MSADDAMVEGYRAGFRSASKSLPACHKDKPAAFRHGWLNGRDDRNQNPRDRASVLRARAGMMERTMPNHLPADLPAPKPMGEEG